MRRRPKTEPRGHGAISAASAYELAKNEMLIEAAGLSLQIQLEADEARRGELEAEYAGVMDELEEFGVGPQDKTLEDPGHYLDKYGDLFLLGLLIQGLGFLTQA